MDKKVHIVMKESIRKQFDSLKVHPRETYEQMIVRAINGELYPEAITTIKEEPNRVKHPGVGLTNSKNG